MKYFVVVQSQYGSHDYMEFDTKEQALQYAANSTGEDTYCIVIEGKQVKFKIVQTAEEVIE